MGMAVVGVCVATLAAAVRTAMRVVDATEVALSAAVDALSPRG